MSAQLSHESIIYFLGRYSLKIFYTDKISNDTDQYILFVLKNAIIEHLFSYLPFTGKVFCLYTNELELKRGSPVTSVMSEPKRRRENYYKREKSK